jgi:hypothetical protein
MAMDQVTYTPISESYEETVRSMIHKENEVINHRVTWLTAVEGFLFAAVGVAWGKSDIEPFIYLSCGIGFLMGLIGLFAVTYASRAMKHLFEWWEQNKPPDYKGPGVIGFPMPATVELRYIGPWSLISLLFMCAWIVVAWINS